MFKEIQKDTILKNKWKFWVRTKWHFIIEFQDPFKILGDGTYRRGDFFLEVREDGKLRKFDDHCGVLFNESFRLIGYYKRCLKMKNLLLVHISQQ